LSDSTLKRLNPTHLLIASLLAPGNIRQEDIATALGVSITTVQRVARSVREGLEGGNELLAARYRRLVEARMPMQNRAKTLAKLADVDKYPPELVLKAIRYIDQLTKTDPIPGYRREEDEKPKPTFKFIFPDGSPVTVNLLQPPGGEKPRDDRRETGDNREPIDVTPEESTDSE